MKYVPSDLQRQIVEHQLLVPRQATFAGMGRGKTSSTLTTLDILTLETSRPSLVIAPKRVAKSTWPREMQKWDHLTGEVAVVVGTAEERLRALLAGLRRGNASLFSTNYDNIPWLVDTLADHKIKWPFYGLIADESTKLKGLRLKQGAKRAAALKKVAFESKRFMALTGTPAPNGLLNLWGQLYFIDAGYRLGDSYTAFRDRWFRKGYDGHTYEPFEHSEREIYDKIRDVCLTIEGVAVDEPIVNRILIELPPAARRQYNEMDKNFWAEVGEHGVEAVHAASKSQKLMQMASGAVYYDDQRNWTIVHDAKLEAAESVLEEANGMPVMMIYYFRHSLERLKAHFPQAVVLDDKASTEDRWNAGKIPMLLVHPQSAGHGLNLQDGSNIACFYDVDWNLEYHDQVIERIGPVRQMQSGHNRPVYLHYILGENTMDEVVVDRLVSKGSVQDALMEAMKRRKA